MSALPVAGPPKHILVVDDNVIGRKLLVRVLEMNGYAVQAVGSGEEAVSSFQASRPSLVLMDCEMPFLNGPDTTRALRNLEDGNEHVPVVAVTLYDDEVTVERCLKAGMDDVYVKPFTRKHLNQMSARYLT